MILIQPVCAALCNADQILVERDVQSEFIIPSRREPDADVGRVIAAGIHPQPPQRFQQGPDLGWLLERRTQLEESWDDDDFEEDEFSTQQLLNELLLATLEATRRNQPLWVVK